MILLSESGRVDVLDVLEAEVLDYTVSNRSEATVSGLGRSPIPAPNVETIQEGLAGIDSDGKSCTDVYDPKTVVTNCFGGAIVERFPGGEVGAGPWSNSDWAGPWSNAAESDPVRTPKLKTVALPRRR